MCECVGGGVRVFFNTPLAACASPIEQPCTCTTCGIARQTLPRLDSSMSIDPHPRRFLTTQTPILTTIPYLCHPKSAQRSRQSRPRTSPSRSRASARVVSKTSTAQYSKCEPTTQMGFSYSACSASRSSTTPRSKTVFPTANLWPKRAMVHLIVYIQTRTI